MCVVNIIRSSKIKYITIIFLNVIHPNLISYLPIIDEVVKLFLYVFFVSSYLLIYHTLIFLFFFLSYRFFISTQCHLWQCYNWSWNIRYIKMCGEYVFKIFILCINHIDYTVFLFVPVCHVSWMIYWWNLKRKEIFFHDLWISVFRFTNLTSAFMPENLM